MSYSYFCNFDSNIMESTWTDKNGNFLTPFHFVFRLCRNSIFDPLKRIRGFVVHFLLWSVPDL